MSDNQRYPEDERVLLRVLLGLTPFDTGGDMAGKLKRILEERDAALARAEAAEKRARMFMELADEANNVREARTRRAEAAESRLADYMADYAAVVNDECAPDEKHCTCVPHLRARLAELQRLAREQRHQRALRALTPNDLTEYTDQAIVEVHAAILGEK